MNKKASLTIPAHVGTMKITCTIKEFPTSAVKLDFKITPDLKIPCKEFMDHQAFYMLIGQTMEPDEVYSVSYYPQNATPEEQKNFPILYAGVLTHKDAPDRVHFKSRAGGFEGVLRPQDILFDYTTGKLVDGITGEFDISRLCLKRLFDFEKYAAQNNPPQKTNLYSETPVRETPQETYFPTRDEVIAANLKAINWTYGGR